MVIKITVEIGTNNNEPFKPIDLYEAQKILLLAQKGVIMEHVNKLDSAGSFPVGEFMMRSIANTYITLRDE